MFSGTLPSYSRPQRNFSSLPSSNIPTPSRPISRLSTHASSPLIASSFTREQPVGHADNTRPPRTSSSRAVQFAKAVVSDGRPSFDTTNPLFQAMSTPVALRDNRHLADLSEQSGLGEQYLQAATAGSGRSANESSVRGWIHDASSFHLSQVN